MQPDVALMCPWCFQQKLYDVVQFKPELQR